jgi:hypothetical protein
MYHVGSLNPKARIGVVQALNRDVERVFESSGKKAHWGKAKVGADR